MDKIYLEGEEAEVSFVEKIIMHLVDISSKRQLSISSIEDAYKMLRNNNNVNVANVMTERYKSVWLGKRGLSQDRKPA